MRKKWFLIAPAAIAAMVLFTFIGGELVMRLWNWLLPSLFSLRQITFWEAVGIMALSRILFGRLGGRGFHRSRFRGRMAERWGQMSPEEREKFRHGMRGRCGVGAPATETGGKE